MQITQTDEEREAFYQQCLQNLKECFPVIPPPTLNQLGVDNIPDCLGEEDEIAIYLADKKWDELSLSKIRREDGDPNAFLYFLNNVGFLYYIPAFMLMFLKEKEEEVDLVGYSILGAIRDRSDLFSLQQKQVIQSILLYVASAAEFEPYDYFKYVFLDPPDNRLQDCIALCSV